MDPRVPHHRSVVPVLYVGRDLTRSGYESLRAHRIGVVVADDATRARRLLSHFRVVAIVFAAPDLPGLSELSQLGIPIVVLAGRDAKCDLDTVTILRRETDPQDLAAVIHGVVRRDASSVAARDAA